MANVNEILLLSLLYFGQGLPYGFQVKVLPLFLRTRNLSLSRVSLSRLLSLPWIFKFAVAPLVDSIWTLRFWITSGLLGMTTFCLVPAILGVKNTHVLLVCVFGMNLTTAAQDVAVDVLAIRLLPPAKLCIGSMLQVIGYKVGVLFAGGLLPLLSVSFGWEVVLFLWGCFYTVAALLLSCQQKEINQSPYPQLEEDTQGNLSEENGDIVVSNIHGEEIQKNFPSSEQNMAFEDCTSVLPAKQCFRINVREILTRVLETPNFVGLLLWVLTYKLGEQGMASLFPLYLLDHGIPQGQVGVVFGIFGQLFSIAGSAMGGWMVHYHHGKRSYVNRILLWTSYARLVPMCLQWMLVFTGTTKPLGAFVAVECLAQSISGTITTATFTLIMSSSQNAPPGTRASNCAILATAEVLGKLLMISFSGILVDLVGYRCFFSLCLCLACFTIFVVKATADATKKVF